MINVAENKEELPMYNAIIRRIMHLHLDLLQKYGLEKIMIAAEQEAEWVGDVEEIGSSDVSISVKRVIDTLQYLQSVANKLNQMTQKELQLVSEFLTVKTGEYLGNCILFTLQEKDLLNIEVQKPVLI
jgi:hypothetical protein